MINIYSTACALQKTVTNVPSTSSLMYTTEYEVIYMYMYLRILAEQSTLKKVEVEYLRMPGWKTSVAGVTKFTDLPINAQNYVKKIEELVGVTSELIIIRLYV